MEKEMEYVNIGKSSEKVKVQEKEKQKVKHPQKQQGKTKHPDKHKCIEKDKHAEKDKHVERDAIKKKHKKASTDQVKLQEMYDKIMNYEQKLHEQNQKRIRIGIICIYVIPLVFLFLLFITESSKIVFLVLWIASLFGIAVYLVIVEYVDYNLQEKMNEISGMQDAQVESLIDIERVEHRVNHLVEKVEARGGEKKA